MTGSDPDKTGYSIREMTPKTMYWIIGIVLAISLLATGIRLAPKGQPAVGLEDGRLVPCPGTPNCVCSEYPSTASYIRPFEYHDNPQSAWQRVRDAVVTSGGTIQQEEANYLWAIFTTRWLHFVDDVELRLDVDTHMIHVRSASRVGRSDFGVNRKRVEKLRLFFNREPIDKHEPDR